VKLMQAARPSWSPWRGRTRTWRGAAQWISDTPTYKIDIDREKASAFGVNLSDVDQTFSIAWGSRYVNNFSIPTAVSRRVYVQADAPFRMNPQDLRSRTCEHQREHGPFTSFAAARGATAHRSSSATTEFRSAQIQGRRRPARARGHDGGDAGPGAKTSGGRRL